MESVLLISSLLLWGVVFFNLLLTVALVRRINNQAQMHNMTASKTMPGLEIGEPAPDFRAETLSGEMVTLGSFTQQPLTLAFVSPSCEPCIEKLPMLNSHALLAKQNGTQFMLVSVGGKAETENFVSEHNVKLPVLVAPHASNPFMQDYKLPGTPYFYFINESGLVQYGGFEHPMQLAKTDHTPHTNNVSLQPA